MSYQALARTWRPRRFSELVGQEHVVRALTHALDSGRLHHAFLFTGTRGVGKTTIARILAKSLNCEKGPTSDPCGECGACLEIDGGRFIDLLEIDAASNTSVDNVRDLIENAMYSPTRGRYKVYLIDEVHMLSKPAFNALLKILEEPPAHVKFLLATTDPQKMLVTVLSRCIKFNLKRLTPEQIGGRMRHILGAEGIVFDEEGIDVLARAADGSLRDGLSLLDQALAHAGGSLEAAEVHAMLGTVERAKVRMLLDILASGDGAALLDEIDRVAVYAPDFGQVLDEFSGLLHRIQLLQLLPGVAGPEDAELLALAGRIGAEDVQLWYQMAITGRRDLALAPTPRVGFEMALLRMLAFVPGNRDSDTAMSKTSNGSGAMPTANRSNDVSGRASTTGIDARQMPRVPTGEATSTANGAEMSAGATSDVAPASDSHKGDGAAVCDDWAALIDRAELRGPVGQLARHATLVGIETKIVRLALKPVHEHFAGGPMIAQLERRLGVALGRDVKIKFERDNGANRSPADQRMHADRLRHQATERAVHSDPVVRSLIEMFDARVVPDSVRPNDTLAPVNRLKEDRT